MLEVELNLIPYKTFEFLTNYAHVLFPVFHQSACISATKRKMSTTTTYVPYPGVLSSTYVLLVTAMYA